jgi:hypothetical protein
MNKYLKGLSHFGVFDSTTKFYISSKDHHVRKDDPVIQYILAQYGVVADNFLVLTPNSVIVKGQYGGLSRINELGKLDLDAFKVRRIFKTGVVKAGKAPNSYVRRTLVNLFRLLLRKGARHIVQINGGSKDVRKQFQRIAEEELSEHPELYTGRVDIGPFGTTQLFIKEHTVGKHNILVTWVEGDGWTN